MVNNQSFPAHPGLKGNPLHDPNITYISWGTPSAVTCTLIYTRVTNKNTNRASIFPNLNTNLRSCSFNWHQTTRKHAREISAQRQRRALQNKCNASKWNYDSYACSIQVLDLGSEGCCHLLELQLLGVELTQKKRAHVKIENNNAERQTRILLQECDVLQE